jgi:hypothetical protein
MVWLSRVVFSRVAFDGLIYDVVSFKGVGCLDVLLACLCVLHVNYLPYYF